MDADAFLGAVVHGDEDRGLALTGQGGGAVSWTRPSGSGQEASHRGSRDHRLTTTFVAGRARLVAGQLSVPSSPPLMRLSALESSCTNLEEGLDNRYSFQRSQELANTQHLILTVDGGDQFLG